jgi:hypothetical protein
MNEPTTPTAPLPAPPHCPHCGAAMTNGIGVYSWSLGGVTIICVHCIAPDCRKGLQFVIMPTIAGEKNSIVGGFN